MTAARHMGNPSPANPELVAWISHNPENQTPSVDHQIPSGADREGSPPGRPEFLFAFGLTRNADVTANDKGGSY